MSTPAPSPNENAAASSFQRVAIAAGALIVVVLTVVIAFFLAAQDLPDGEPTPISQVSPAATATNTPTFAFPAPTPPSPPAATPSATPTPSAIIEPPTSTPSLPTAIPTDTRVPPTSTATSTPVIVIVTPTPLPATPAAGACQPPPSWVSYQVQPGDTLNSLATRTNSSEFELHRVNCLDSFTLRVGQTLYLPFTPPTPTITFTPGPTRHPTSTPTKTPTPIKPQIDKVVPDQVDETTAQSEVILTVLGKNFTPREADFTVELRGPQNVSLRLGEARSSTSFDAIVPPGLPVGTYDLVVTNLYGRAGVRESAYTIGPAPPTATPAAPPTIDDFNPTSGNISDSIDLLVRGRNFRPSETGFKVELRKTAGGFRVELEVLDDPTPTDRIFEANIPANTLEPGDYNLVVTNADGQFDISEDEYNATE